MPNKKRFLDRARNTYDSTTDNIIDVKDKTKETIQDHPFVSILAAAAIGAAVGVITSESIRMMRKRNKRR